MLQPHDRSLYLEALRPPPGYRLDRAVGTTYSVDLLSLMAVPLSFTQLDWADDREGLLADPVSLLGSLREYTNRVTLFCQAGRIALPRRQPALFAYLEPMVIAAEAPVPAAEFHPKTWLLRFTSVADEPIRYRFLCLSRNLTTDRSWDTVLSLEGELLDRQNAISANHPLGEFVEALPGLARGRLTEAAKADLARMAWEARRVRFDPPEPFEDVQFFPLGIEGHEAIDLETEDSGRALFVSPFLSKELLEQIAVASENTLVSRQESLDELPPEALKAFEKVYVLDDGADLDSLSAGDDEAEAEGLGADTAAELEPADPRGLHAKLYVVERGWDVEVLTGSANATTAGFERNVEFLVQLTGKKSKVGVSSLLGNGGTEGTLFGSLLQEYRRPGEPYTANDEALANEKLLEQTRRVFSKAELELRASPSGGLYELRLVLGSKLDLPDGVRARCWPATLKEPEGWNAGALAGERTLLFERLSVAQLTSFLSVEASAGTGEARRAIRFALVLPLEGAPVDRLEQVLAAVLQEPGQFLRFLLFLLSDESPDAAGSALLLQPAEHGAGAARNGECATPLLEDLLRVLARSPERLREVHRLVEDLKKSEAGRNVLPSGWDEVWNPVWLASGVTA